ncbi:MAG TPA: hypothetical protein PLL10_01305, partial [Elusimicrobiales bacterium]|nr:hypothetical protein [Elusimicrobiales bacterium]
MALAAGRGRTRCDIAPAFKSRRRPINWPASSQKFKSPLAGALNFWRGRQPANTTDSFSSEDAKTDFPYSEMPVMPAFSLCCGLQIGIIANGEKLLEETVERFDLP